MSLSSMADSEVKQEVDDLLFKGKQAARQGNMPLAYAYFRKVNQLDHDNEEGWLWRAGVVDDPAETKACLEEALSLNPSNERAVDGLRWLGDQHPALFADAFVEVAAVGEPLPFVEALREAAAKPAAPADTSVEPAISTAEVRTEPAMFADTATVDASEAARQQSSPGAATGGLEEETGFTPVAAARRPIRLPRPVPNADGTINLVRCPRCGKKNFPEDGVCLRCGTSLTAESDRIAIAPITDTSSLGESTGSHALRTILLIVLTLAVIGVAAWLGINRFL